MCDRQWRWPGTEIVPDPPALQPVRGHGGLRNGGVRSLLCGGGPGARRGPKRRAQQYRPRIVSVIPNTGFSSGHGAARPITA
jgi:hypothetical protein